MKQVIKNVRIVDPYHDGGQIGDVSIADGIITGLGEKVADFTPDTVLEANETILMPGLVDLLVVIPEASSNHKATLQSEALAAAHAGITTVCCAPTIKSAMDTPEAIELMYARSQSTKGAHVFMYGALTQGLQSSALSNMAALKRAGCVAVTNAYQPIKDTYLLRHCFEYAATVDLPVVIMPQDGYLSEKGLVHEGQVNARSGLIGIPAIAESIDVARALMLAEFTGTRLHFSQISTAQSVDLISAAKAKGLSVTADVSINHLFLTEIDVSEFDTNCFVFPPLRSLQDQHMLIKGLQDGTLDAICSAHTPHDKSRKHSPFSEAAPGIASLELLASLSFRLVLQGKLTLKQWVSCLTSNPASIMDTDINPLKIGATANLCLFDPQAEFLVDKHHLRSAAQNVPYHQWPLEGRVVLTQIGETIFCDHA